MSDATHQGFKRFARLFVSAPTSVNLKAVKMGDDTLNGYITFMYPEALKGGKDDVDAVNLGIEEGDHTPILFGVLPPGQWSVDLDVQDFPAVFMEWTYVPRAMLHEAWSVPDIDGQTSSHAVWAKKTSGLSKANSMNKVPCHLGGVYGASFPVVTQNNMLLVDMAGTTTKPDSLFLTEMALFADELDGTQHVRVPSIRVERNGVVYIHTHATGWTPARVDAPKLSVIAESLGARDGARRALGLRQAGKLYVIATTNNVRGFSVVLGGTRHFVAPPHHPFTLRYDSRLGPAECVACPTTLSYITVLRDGFGPATPADPREVQLTVAGPDGVLRPSQPPSADVQTALRALMQGPDHAALLVHPTRAEAEAGDVTRVALVKPTGQLNGPSKKLDDFSAAKLRPEDCVLIAGGMCQLNRPKVLTAAAAAAAPAPAAAGAAAAAAPAPAGARRQKRTVVAAAAAPALAVPFVPDTSPSSASAMLISSQLAALAAGPSRASNNLMAVASFVGGAAAAPAAAVAPVIPGIPIEVLGAAAAAPAAAAPVVPADLGADKPMSPMVGHVEDENGLSWLFGDPVVAPVTCCTVCNAPSGGALLVEVRCTNELCPNTVLVCNMYCSGGQLGNPGEDLFEERLPPYCRSCWEIVVQEYHVRVADYNNEAINAETTAVNVLQSMVRRALVRAAAAAAKAEVEAERIAAAEAEEAKRVAAAEAEAARMDPCVACGDIAHHTHWCHARCGSLWRFCTPCSRATPERLCDPCEAAAAEAEAAAPEHMDEGAAAPPPAVGSKRPRDEVESTPPFVPAKAAKVGAKPAKAAAAAMPPRRSSRLREKPARK